MTIKEELQKIEAAIDKITEDTHDEEVSDEEAAEITDLINAIDQKFMTLMAEHNIEVGDERTD